MTARRERGRKKQKTEKERSIWGGKSCTRLGFPGGGAGESPVAAEHAGPSVGWSPSGVFQGRSWSGDAEELPPLSPGIWSLSLHQHKKMMGSW